ncbi:MAG: hypothetical protein K0S47_1930 [Herbinix sp.]|jgi:LysM repeat protein|nr:hypothetical protein [Herbinix sp.]
MCNGINHIIQKGDTLYSISRNYNVPLELIMRENPFTNVYNLQIGDVLCIPTKQMQEQFHFTTYLIEDGDTIGTVLDKNGIMLDDMLLYNDLYSIYLEPGMTLHIPIQDIENSTP